MGFLTDKKVLEIIIKKEFFDMIVAGVKKEEYREYKPFWVSRLMDGLEFKEFDVLKFKNGYASGAPTVFFECLGIEYGKPKAEWCGKQFVAPEDLELFIIKIGENLCTGL